MKRLFIVFTITVCLPLLACAQKKVIAQARTYVKSGKELAKAEKMMSELLADSANRGNDKIWLTLFEAVRKQYEQGNEKLYLKQSYDTATLFNTAARMFTVLEAFDSIEATPDQKGRVKIKYRGRHAAYLNTYRPNLYNGGTFFLRRQDYAKAYQLYDAYIDCARQPLFTDYRYAVTDSMMPQAAYWALYAAYKQHDAGRMMQHRSMAERDSLHIDFVTQYVAEASLWTGDTATYAAMLERGFLHTPTHPFFFPRLMDYYTSIGRADSAMVTVDRMLQADSLNQLSLFAKSTLLLNKGDNDGCIDITRRLLALNDSMPDAYCNMGLAYFNKAVAADASGKPSRKLRRQVRELYSQSLPYMERFRQLAPEQKSKWVPVLYTIYLNLNMGQQFGEIDRIRSAMEKENTQ